MVKPLPNLPLTSLPLHTGVVYELEEDTWVFWHAETESLHHVSGLGCWILLGLDQGQSSTQLLDEYTINHKTISQKNIDSLNAQIEQIQHILSLTSDHKVTYQEEYCKVLATPACTHDKGEGVYLHTGCINIHVTSKDPSILCALRSVCAQETLLSIPDTIDCQFDIEPDSQGHYCIWCNGHLLSKSLTPDQWMPVLMDYFQIMSYQSQEYLLAVHAAVVAKAGLALILPGLSGAGKSTLCVSLVEQGFTCYSDELAILGEPDGTVQALPLPMAVKSGSWPILEKSWPELSNSPIWERPDGRKLKYLQLPDAAYPNSKQVIPTHQHIIFPKYDPQCRGAEITCLSPSELLRQLTQVGYQIKTSLDQKKVERLLHFVGATPAHALRYASLDDAHTSLHKLIQR